MFVYCSYHKMWPYTDVNDLIGQFRKDCNLIGQFRNARHLIGQLRNYLQFDWTIQK